MSSKFVIKVGREFYIGKTYTHQGEYFPGVTTSADNAKWYKTLNIAKRAKATLENKVSHEHNIYIQDEHESFIE